MQFRNFKQKRVLVTTLTGHSICFEPNETKEVSKPLIEPCLEHGLAPTEDTSDLGAQETAEAAAAAEAEAAAEAAKQAEAQQAALAEAQKKADAEAAAKRSEAAKKAAATRKAKAQAKK